MEYELDFSVMWKYRALLLEGLFVTVQMFFISQVSATLLGLVTALLRMSQSLVVRVAATAYLEFFRNTPLLVQIVWFFYLLPVLLNAILPGGPYDVPTFWIAVIALTMHIGAYLSEVFRAGILAVPRGHTEAARSVGLSRSQTFRRIVLPQAAVTVIPPYLTYAVFMLKATALVSVIGGVEFLYTINQINQVAYRSIEMYSAAAVIYFLLALPFLLAVARLERRIRRRWSA